MTGDMHSGNNKSGNAGSFNHAGDQDDQLKILFASFADAPPPTSLSSLRVMSRALSQSRSRTRRRAVLGIAAAVVVLGVGGSVLVPQLEGTSDEQQTASSVSAGLLQVPVESAALSSDPSGPNVGARSSSLATAAAGAEGGAVSDAGGAPEDSASAESGAPATSAAAGSATSAAPGSGFDIQLAPEASDRATDSARCLLSPLPERAVQQVNRALAVVDPPIPITRPCGSSGTGSAFQVGAEYLAIYWLAAGDPCADSCTPGPTSDVRFRTLPPETAALVTATDGRVLVLQPLQPNGFDLTALVALGRQVLTATAE